MTENGTPLPLGRLLTAAELAKELGASERQIYRWADDGHLPKVKLGRAVRFHEPTIREWLERGTLEEAVAGP